ncbi:MAG: N5-glutamine methyltransferase family protein, partial [Alphaproteobacteria bacterium]
AIAIALSTSAPPGSRGTVFAIDRSADALRVARANVERHRADARWPVVPLRGDLLSAMAPASLDLVLSNPPYLSPAEMEEASPELRFEPPSALAGGDPDGLGVVRALVGQAAAVLVPGGFLAVEIGAAQAASALGIFDPGTWRDPAIVRDIEGRDRVMVARRDPLA